VLSHFTAGTAVALVALGFAVGTFGTLVGAGGGFILTPVLLLAYPGTTPNLITAISLVAVFFNAGSGSLAYLRQRRVDLRTGVVFAACTLPGSVLGVLAAGSISRPTFDVIMGLALTALALWLLRGAGQAETDDGRARASGVARSLVDREGHRYEFRVRLRLGAVLSVGVGFLSSFLGIGGGVVHVPLMVGLLGVPTHIATATSHFILAFMALVATLAHVVTGTFAHGAGLRRAAALSVGVVAGAQLGAWLSARVGSHTIERLLAAGLLLLGLRLVLSVVL
jgi:uncharacterized protein